MDIVYVEFENKMYLTVNHQPISLVCFKTDEHGNVKFGVDAPRDVSVNREEIAELKKLNNT